MDFSEVVVVFAGRVVVFVLLLAVNVLGVPSIANITTRIAIVISHLLVVVAAEGVLFDGNFEFLARPDSTFGDGDCVRLRIVQQNVKLVPLLQGGWGDYPNGTSRGRGVSRSSRRILHAGTRPAVLAAIHWAWLAAMS